MSPYFTCCCLWWLRAELVLLFLVVARASNTPMDAVIAETTQRESIGRSSVHRTYCFIQLSTSKLKSIVSLPSFLNEGTKGSLSHPISSFSSSVSPSTFEDPFEISSVDMALYRLGPLFVERVRASYCNKCCMARYSICFLFAEVEDTHSPCP